MLLECDSCKSKYKIDDSILAQKSPKSGQQMFIRCQNCQNKIIISNQLKKELVDIYCSNCQAEYAVDRSKFKNPVIKMRCFVCNSTFDASIHGVKSTNQKKFISSKNAESNQAATNINLDNFSNLDFKSTDAKNLKSEILEIDEQDKVKNIQKTSATIEANEIDAALKNDLANDEIFSSTELKMDNNSKINDPLDHLNWPEDDDIYDLDGKISTIESDISKPKIDLKLPQSEGMNNNIINSNVMKPVVEASDKSKKENSDTAEDSFFKAIAIGGFNYETTKGSIPDDQRYKIFKRPENRNFNILNPNKNIGPKSINNLIKKPYYTPKAKTTKSKFWFYFAIFCLSSIIAFIALIIPFLR